MENAQAYFSSAEMLSFLVSSRFFLILWVIVLSSLKHSIYRNFWLYVFINLPGTALHECAHFLVGLILNARPVNFSLLPRKKDGYYNLGRVSFSNLRFYNALPTGMAPFLLLVFAYFFDKHFFDFVSVNCVTYLLYIFLLTLFIEHSMPSRADFREAFGSVGGILFYSLLSSAAILLAFRR